MNSSQVTEQFMVCFEKIPNRLLLILLLLFLVARAFHPFIIHSLKIRTTIKWLQEIVWGAATNVIFSTAWGWIELQEGVILVFIKLHDGCLVPTTIAIVGG